MKKENQLKKWAADLLKRIKSLPRYAPSKNLKYRDVVSENKKVGGKNEKQRSNQKNNKQNRIWKK